MATTDWPEALIPQTAQLMLRKSGTQFASPFNGTLQALDFIAERWTLSASLAQMAARNPRGVHAFCNTLAGGVERVRVWPFHTKGVPLGTLRGAPVLSAGVTRGATALPITGALSGPNLISRGSFEDNPSAGLAVGWLQYSNGATGTITASRVSGSGSPFAQRLDATALGGAAVDQVGIRRSGDVDVVAGRVYSLSTDTRDSGTAVRVQIDWFNVSAAYLSSASAVFGSSGAVWARRSVSGVAPAGAVVARIYVWMEARTGGVGAAALEVDNVQFEASGAASSYAGPASVRAGDYLGCGGQLFQVAADTVLLDSGEGSVPVVNRVRGTVAVASAVVWYRPTCEMVLPAMQAGPVHRPGVIESTALDFVEVW